MIGNYIIKVFSYFTLKILHAVRNTRGIEDDNFLSEGVPLVLRKMRSTRLWPTLEQQSPIIWRHIVAEQGTIFVPTLIHVCNDCSRRCWCRSPAASPLRFPQTVHVIAAVKACTQSTRCSG